MNQYMTPEQEKRLADIMHPPRRKFSQNILLELTGLFPDIWRCLITVYDTAITQRLYACDGEFAYPDHGYAQHPDAEWLRDTVLQLQTTPPEEIANKLRQFFGPGNVFMIPHKGYIAGSLIGEAGISAFVSFDCDKDID